MEDDSSIDELAFGALTIFPNPNRGSFTVRLSETLSGEAQMEIADVSGRIQHASRMQLNGNAFTWQGDLNPGVYYLKLVDLHSGQQFVARCIVR